MINKIIKTDLFEDGELIDRVVGASSVIGGFCKELISSIVPSSHKENYFVNGVCFLGLDPAQFLPRREVYVLASEGRIYGIGGALPAKGGIAPLDNCG